ncbi:MAG: PAS domain S-box protein, partial [Mobilitalea sp.]
MKDISLKSIIEELPIGVVCLEIIKEDGQPVDYLVVDVNKDFVILTERLKEDMIGRRMSQIMPASLDETLELKGFLNEVMIDGTKKVTEQFIAAVKKLYRITAYQSDEKHIIINFKDVSDEMLNMEGLDHYFDIKNDLMCITDIDGNFIKVNHTWEDIMGYSTEELENKPYYNYLHPEDIDITKQELDKLHTNAKIINFINRYRCKDKTYRYLEWRCKLNHNIIYAVARDVTDSKNIESQLQNKTILLNQLLDSIPDIITYKDKDGNYLGCNQEFSKYIGMREEEIIGKNDYQLFTKEIADHNIRFDNLVINENKTAHHQEELIYTDK